MKQFHSQIWLQFLMRSQAVILKSAFYRGKLLILDSLQKLVVFIRVFSLLDLVQNCRENFGTSRIIYTSSHTWKDINCSQHVSPLKALETDLQSIINCRERKKKPKTPHRATRNLKKSSSPPTVHRKIKGYGFPEKNPTTGKKDIQRSKTPWYPNPLHYLTEFLLLEVFSQLEPTLLKHFRALYHFF